MTLIYKCSKPSSVFKSILMSDKLKFYAGWWHMSTVSHLYTAYQIPAWWLVRDWEKSIKMKSVHAAVTAEESSPRYKNMCYVYEFGTLLMPVYSWCMVTTNKSPLSIPTFGPLHSNFHNLHMHNYLIIWTIFTHVLWNILLTFLESKTQHIYMVFIYITVLVNTVETSTLYLLPVSYTGFWVDLCNFDAIFEPDENCRRVRACL